MKVYSSKDARLKFSDILRDCLTQPVMITRRGKDVAAVVSVKYCRELLPISVSKIKKRDSKKGKGGVKNARRS